jgi:hypothetical protein
MTLSTVLPDNSDSSLVAESQSHAESSFPPCGGRSGWGVAGDWSSVVGAPIPTFPRKETVDNRDRDALSRAGEGRGEGDATFPPHRARQ